MSRIGKLPIQVPTDVQIEIIDNTFKAIGRYGELSQTIPQEISVEIDSGCVFLKKKEISKKAQQKKGEIFFWRLVVFFVV